MTRRAAAVACAGLALAAGCAVRPPLLQLEPPGREARLAGDGAAVRVYREGLRGVVAYVGTRPDFFPPTRPAAPRVLAPADRAAIRDAWRRFLDYLLALDAVAKYHAGWDRLDQPARDASFRIVHAAFVAPYRFSVELLDRLSADPDLDVLLDEPVPDLGLPAGTYARVKFRFLNVLRATEFAGWAVLARGVPPGVAPELAAAIEEDTAYLWRAGRGRGEALTLANAGAVVRRAGAAAWFPVQAGVAEWMGDTRLSRRATPLVSAAQIAALGETLQPGDILLVRREWYLSNIGLPGFWPHAVLYVGTPELRRAAFGADEEARLAAAHPAAYARSLVAEDGHPRRALEAVSEGVVFTALEHAAGGDSVAVLRPRVPAAVRAAAVRRAFGYAGRPYDFDFDFRTDAALVCTELVFKAYETSPLRFPLVDMLGRPVMPANELARRFDADFVTPAQQFDLVVFLDGQEHAGTAIERPVDAFRQSWRRPKWRLGPEP